MPSGPPTRAYGERRIDRGPPAAGRPAREAAVAVTALAAAAFIVSGEARVVAPLLPAIAASLGVPVAVAGTAVTAYLLPYGLCQMIYGPLGDRIGKLQVIRWAMAVLAAGTFACAFAPTLATLDLLRLAAGAAAAAVFPMALAHVGDSLPYSERPRAIGMLMSGAAIGQTLSMAIGGIIGQLLSWRLVFALYGGVAFAIAAWLARLGPPDPAPDAAGRALKVGPWWAPYRDLACRPAARALYVTVAIEGFFAFGPFAYVAALLVERNGLSTLAASLVLTANGLGALAGSRLVAVAARRLGERGAVLAGGLAAGVPYLLLALPIGWHYAPMLLLVMGCGWPIAHAVLQIRATEVAPAARGTSLALFAFALFLGGGLGTAMHGLLVAGPGYPAAMAVGGLGLCAFAVLAPRGLGLGRAARLDP